MKDNLSRAVHEYYLNATLCAGPVGSGYLEVQLDAVVSYNQAAGEMLILEKGQFTMPPIPWLWKAKLQIFTQKKQTQVVHLPCFSITSFLCISDD